MRLWLVSVTTAAAIAAGVPVYGARASDQAAPVTLAPGDLAPPFTLKASDGRTYRLADYRGKQAVVLAWFAKAFTSG